jgi:uncharacterized protein
MEGTTPSNPPAEAIEPWAAATPLDPRHLHLLRVRGLILAGLLLTIVGLADLGPLRETPVPAGAATGAVLLIAIVALIFLPGRRYRAWGYGVGRDELHIRSGVWTRVRTAVPYGRVQHIDVTQGPIQRLFGLGTLILHTAGTRGSAVALPGLDHDKAERMRDSIRAMIRQDLV